MGNNPAKTSRSPSSENSNDAEFEKQYAQVMEAANISAQTWEEFENKLEDHLKSDKMDKEWQFLSVKQDSMNDPKLFATASAPENKEKNRYINILPYETTRVKLPPVEGVPGSDYINANHVMSGEINYICCQAPTKDTIPDFFRMLWETNSSTVVMLTKTIELGKVKAIEYWPAVGESPVKHGDIEVHTHSERTKESGSYVVRRMVMKRNGEKRTVRHFHFLAWPDHDVPDVFEPFKKLSQRVQQRIRKLSKASPVVVHCSAGIGRTGTYIVITTILEDITNAKKNNEKPPAINLMQTVHRLREMRTGMVNHPDQYEYCYKTILAHVKEQLGHSIDDLTKKSKHADDDDDEEEVPTAHPHQQPSATDANTTDQSNTQPSTIQSSSS